MGQPWKERWSLQQRNAGLGAGFVRGLDPDEYNGFYVNIGLDRLVMMRYGVDDVRLFHSADLRFLKQFH